MSFDLASAKPVDSQQSEDQTPPPVPTSDNTSFNPNTATASEGSVVHVADKDMTVQAPADMPNHQFMASIYDQVYGKYQFPAIDDSYKKNFIGSLGNGLLTGISKTIQGVAKIFGPQASEISNKFTFTPQQQNVIDQEDVGHQYGQHLGEQVGGLLSGVPLAMGVGEVASAPFAATMVMRSMGIAAKFVIGSGLLGGAEGAADQAGKGAGAMVKGAVTGAAEGAIPAALYTATPAGLWGFAAFPAIGVASATYEAAKQNRLPTTRELAYNAADGFAMAAVFSIAPFLATKIPGIGGKTIMDAHDAAKTAAKTGDLDGIQSAYKKLTTDENIPGNIRTGLQNVHDESVSDNRTQMENALPIKQEMPNVENNQEEDQPGSETAANGEQTSGSGGTGWEGVSNKPTSALSNEKGQLDTSIIPGADKLAEKGKQVKDFIDRSSKYTPLADNTEKSLIDLQQNKMATAQEGVNILEKSLKTVSPEDRLALDKYVDNIDVFGDAKDANLNSKQQEIYDSVIKPLKDSARGDFDVSRNGGVPLARETYFRRDVMEKGSFLDRVKEAAQSGKEMVQKAVGGNVLKKSSAHFKKRTMKGIEDEAGNRGVVSIKDGRVLAMSKNAKGEIRTTDLGPHELKTYADLKENDLEPISAQEKKLDTEYGTLTKTSSRISAASARIKNIEAEKIDIQNQRQAIDDKYAKYNMGDQVFTDKNDHQWRIGDATKSEIEANTNLKYLHDPITSAVAHFVEMKNIANAVKWIDAFKTSKEFQDVAVKFGEGDVPEGWKPTSMPQFMGYAFEPRTADVLDSFYKRIQNGEDAANVLSEVNRFLVSSIFWNPFVHTPNMLANHLFQRGTVRWFMPKSYANLFHSTLQAIDAVKNKDENYIANQRAGLHQMDRTTTMADAMRKQFVAQLKSNPELAHNISMAMGYKKIGDMFKAYEKLNEKATWGLQDILNNQAVFEGMREGLSREASIDRLYRYAPDYRIPARVLDSKQLADVLKNRDLTMFSAYHYGMVKNVCTTIRNTLNFGNRKLQLEAADRALALAAMAGIMYPLLDNFARMATGNKDASFRRAGALSFPFNTYDFLTGKKSAFDYASSVVSPSPVPRMGVELLSGRDIRTGKSIRGNPSEFGNYLKSQVSLLSQEERLRQGHITGQEMLASVFSIKSPHQMAHSDAEQEALTIRNAKSFGGGEYSQQDQEKHRLMANLSDGFAKTHDSSELQKSLSDGDITSREMRNIEKNANLPPIVRMTKSFSYQEVQTVMGKANPQERAELQPVLIKKIQNKMKIASMKDRVALQSLLEKVKGESQ